VRKAADEIESRKDELDSGLDAHMASAQQDFQELVQATQEAEQKAAQQLQQAAQRIATLREAIENARSEFAQKHETWGDAVQELENTVQENTDEWIDALNQLLRRQSQALVGAGNTMVDEHNAAMARLKQRFVEQAPEDLAAALDPVEVALTALGEEAAESGPRLSAEARQLEQWALAALPDTAQIQAALELAAALE
jgi:DNA repair exonuclease SbcCD ATPase subunit